MELTADALLTYFRDKLRVDTSKIEPETILFSSGLVDSFSMVELIVFIEKSCQIKVKPAEVNLDNLDSIERILAFVARRVSVG
ncbi:MAG: acyl carrier protein [Planctomycetota bacterium]|jgi:acyl carrier protein